MLYLNYIINLYLIIWLKIVIMTSVEDEVLVSGDAAE